MDKLKSKNTRVEYALMAAILFCIALYLLVFAFTNFKGFSICLNPDMYSDSLISKYMWEQKTLFPDSWVFGNQYYVIATPVLASLFYGITGNTNTAMALATETMTVFLLLSFLWMFRAVSRNTLTCLTACLLLLSSVMAPMGGILSPFGQLFFLLASYYACYTITMFVVFGDYIRSFHSEKPRYLPWLLSLVLSFATGMQSIRQMAVMVLPILACELFQALRRMLKRQPAWSRENIRSLVRALSYAVANAAGLLFIRFLHIPNNSIWGSFQPASRENMLQQLSTIVRALFEVTSIDTLLSPTDPLFFKFLALLWLALFIWAAFLWFSRIRKPESPLESYWLLCLLGIAGTVLASMLFRIELRSVYLFMWFPMAVFSTMIVLDRFSGKKRLLSIVLVCVLSLGNLYLSYIPNIQQLLSPTPLNSEMMCHWAMEEGYSYVYGSWFSVPYVAAHSGGKLEAGYWYASDTIFHPLPYLGPQNIYGPEQNEKALYIFTPEDEQIALAYAAQRNITLEKVAEFGRYRAYTSPVPLNVIP